jgi:protein SMG7
MDLIFASQENVHDTLWQTHVHVTNSFRKAISKAQRPEHVVLKRKLEKHYMRYIKTAQDFYKGFLQRFCARYDIKDLRRIAGQAKLSMSVPEEDQVSPETSEVSDIVKEIGYMTLIYLGDLCRYRTLMRAPESRTWEPALTYYALANDLLPGSGYGHHQCGVIYLENHDHFSVLYHLLRSLTCDKPHPNALVNVERECRNNMTRGQYRQSDSSKEALVFWHVKLHAFLFRGEEFRQYDELVAEVLHRIGLALKQDDDLPVDKALLKLVLINICAYRVSLDKVKSEFSQTVAPATLKSVHTTHTIFFRDVRG